MTSRLLVIALLTHRDYGPVCEHFERFPSHSSRRFNIAYPRGAITSLDHR
jgi:hypothetical protein